MNHLELIGLLLLVGIAAAGTVIKCITRRQLGDMDGISGVFTSRHDENVVGKF
ncbi:hypothetical protein [Christensenella intestinihominis]|uniref:hypothetical protein n=1 Tax=Christensenella intestinihominis TaxID=1851429 RepID=UPI0012E9DAF9|nr:hypothetical protein [Christensenella intestinihominis]